MKYNGKEVTDEIAELIHQKVNEEFVPGDHDYIYNSDILRVLQAAQEVMQEMEPKHDIKVGDRVRKVGVPTFGTSAQVVSIEGDTANIIWGLVSRPAPYKVNELVKTKEAQHGEG